MGYPAVEYLIKRAGAEQGRNTYVATAYGNRKLRVSNRFLRLLRLSRRFAGVKIRQFSERRHATLGLRSVDLRLDDRVIVGGGARGQANLSVLGVNPENLEFHLLPQLYRVFRFVNALIGQF